MTGFLVREKNAGERDSGVFTCVFHIEGHSIFIKTYLKLVGKK